MADKYDMEPDDLTSRVEERMKESMDRSFRETLFGYETLIPVREDIHMTKKGRVAYALLPVWFLKYEVAGEDVFFCYERADRTLLRRSSHRKGYGFALLDEDTYSNDGGVRRTFSDQHAI